MIESARFVIAYWLFPAAQGRDFFRETIQRLAMECDAPLFEPHLTLAVGPDVLGEPDRTLDRVTSGPVELPVVGIAFTSTFTKTLFVRFDSTQHLLQLRDSLGRGGDESFAPHLSLLYKTLPEAEQAKLATEIQLPFATVTFDSIAAIHCRLPVASAADVVIWRSIRSRELRAPA